MGDTWDDAYREVGALWGDRPSELARLAVDVLRREAVTGPSRTVLDVGCGYGRDALYLWRELEVSVVGIDPSPRAVELARAATPAGAPVEFACASLEQLDRYGFAAITCTNVYHLLEASARRGLAAAVQDRLARGGLLFLMTLAPDDPEHFGKGRPVADDPGSFVDRVFLHFADADELRRDFAGLDIEHLEQHAYVEERAAGHRHHHVSWRLVGRKRSG